MDLPNFLEKLLVVIVLFRMRPENSIALTSLRTSLAGMPLPDLFVYDNSPHPSDMSGVSITYVHDPANSGVSKAYNTAAAHAGGTGKTWMLLLDEDTVVTSSLFAKYSAAIDLSPGSVAFVPRMTDAKGLVSPFAFACGRGKRLRNLSQTSLPLEGYRFVNSGLLIRQSDYTSAGGYDESIPLDFSDIAFAERLKKVNDRFTVIDESIPHDLSGETTPPLAVALARFRYFCTGAIRMGKEAGGLHMYIFQALVRATKLSILYKNPRFLSTFIHRSIHG